MRTFLILSASAAFIAGATVYGDWRAQQIEISANAYTACMQAHYGESPERYMSEHAGALPECNN